MREYTLFRIEEHQIKLYEINFLYVTKWGHRDFKALLH